MKKYKLVSRDLRTRIGEENETQWVVGEWQPELSGEGELCSEGFYHYYHSPLLAALLNPTHANIENPYCFEAETGGKHLDDNGVKGGCTKMRLVVEVDLPVISMNQRIAFAILCAKEVYKVAEWNQWADDWLNGKDRSAASAYAAAYSANSAAANSAAYSAYAAYADSANATYSAYAAANSANSAAYAWDYKKLFSIAEKAMRYK